MRSLSIFQLVLIFGAGIIAIIGVILFATFRGGPGAEALPPVVVWGTVDEGVMRPLLNELKQADENYTNVSYVERDARTYSADFVDALASGTGPDLFLLSEADLLTHADKIITVPFDVYSERTFRSTFVEAGELFLTAEGVRGLPFSIDPLVLYWNRDIFAGEGLANPPAFWDEFFTLAPRITHRDQSANITQSFAALGEFRNIGHAKDILAALILQTGNPIVGATRDRGYVSTLNETYDFIEAPAVSALRFYTEFANPVKSVYSWNRALPSARQSFISGDLALYIGFASELPLLRELNPNLNFDVAPLPRPRDVNRAVTLAHVDAFAIPRGSSNAEAAFAVARKLTEAQWVARYAELSGLPPVRRDLLGETPTDAVRPVFYTGAVAAKAWLDPDPAETDAVFQNMIESTLSGRARLNDAVQTATAELNNLLR